MEEILFNPFALLYHNANVVMMAFELANAVPIHISHFPMSALYGLLYVFMTWALCGASASQSTPS